VHACVGGTSVREDIRILQSGVHVVVGTPGRVYDMLRRNSLRADYIKMIVLDEADEMLSRGFKDQVKFKNIKLKCNQHAICGTLLCMTVMLLSTWHDFCYWYYLSSTYMLPTFSITVYFIGAICLLVNLSSHDIYPILR
jgi:hypothetical protein